MWRLVMLSNTWYAKELSPTALEEPDSEEVEDIMEFIKTGDPVLLIADLDDLPEGLFYEID